MKQPLRVALVATSAGIGGSFPTASGDPYRNNRQAGAKSLGEIGAQGR
jgi:hypothetical protein